MKLSFTSSTQLKAHTVITLEIGDVIIGRQLGKHLSQTLSFHILKNGFHQQKKKTKDTLRDLPKEVLVKEIHSVSLSPVSSPNFQLCLWG